MSISHATTLSDLAKRLKPGYTVETRASGAGHHRVLDPEGKPARSEDGRPLMIAAKAGDAHTIKNTEAQLRAAGVLEPRRRGPNKKRSNGHQPADISVKREIQSLADQAAQRDAEALHRRLAEVLEPVGGLELPGMQSDLSAIGVEIARELGMENVTADLLATNIYRVVHQQPIELRYYGIWETLALRLETAENLRATFFRLIRQAKGLSEPATQQLKLRFTEDGWPYRIELVEVEACFADEAYQRPVPWPFVRSMAAGFDPTLVGVIDVSKRGRADRYAILDGQCRWQTLRLVGRPNVYAAIYEGLDLPTEAALFLRKNRDRKAVHTFYVYRARVLSGDPIATEIERIVNRAGYKTSPASAASGTPADISAVVALEEAFKRTDKQGRECLSPTLKTMKAATWDRPQGNSAYIIRGLARLYSINDRSAFDSERLDNIVLELGPQMIVARARDLSLSEKGWPGKILAVIASAYNQGIRAHADRLSYE
jgi:Family of unknown function (DUF6551)